MEKVVAIVVTYNRKELLQECLDALMNQTYPLNKIIVINNCSTDGTDKLFEEGAKYHVDNIELVTTSKNLGGAGGFCEGIKIADTTDCDLIWIMDDDTIAYNDSLEGLIESRRRLRELGVEKVGYLASVVFGPENEPMNVPVLERKATANGYSDWYKYLNDGMVKIKSATFVSIIVEHEAVKELGYPLADYFIWGDDTEYTQRLSSQYGEAFFCGKSRVLHKRFNAKSISIFNENNPDRIGMYFYYFRNSLLNAKKYNKKGNSFLHICEYELMSAKCLLGRSVKYRWKKFYAIQKGIFCYLFKSGHLK